MKKWIVLTIVALMSLPALVSADYQAKTGDEVRGEIGAFFQRNQGSKITIDVMDGLMLHLNQIFEANIIKPPPPKAPAIPRVGPDNP